MDSKNEEKMNEIQEDLLKKNIQQQLDEFQMLSAIFCGSGEIQVDDYSCVEHLTGFTNGETTNLNKMLDFRINLPLLANEKVQILVELPHFYPTLEIPRIVIRSSFIHRDRERKLGKLIEQYIKNDVTERDEPYVYQVICWIQDNFSELLLSTVERKNHRPNSTAEGKQSASERVDPLIFERLWIYSHHLRSKSKRQSIVQTARDLGLSGFSRPGKPAIICVEGIQSDTRDFWRTIKSLKWQKIQIKLSETSTVSSVSSIAVNGLRRFDGGFREELFCVLGEDSEAEDLPMSMSLFMKFLEKHQCGFIKNHIFGFENPVTHPAN